LTVARTGQALYGAALLVLLSVSGCADKPAAKTAAAKPAAAPRTCTIETKIGTDRPIKERQFPSTFWFSLLLSSYRSSGGVLEQPVIDCSGRAVTIGEDGCGREPLPSAVSSEHLNDDDLVVVDAGGANRLVWVKTDRLATGEVQGPVGLVEITEKGLAVRALGVLRSYPERMTMRIENLSEAVFSGDLTGEVTIPTNADCCRTEPGCGTGQVTSFSPAPPLPVVARWYLNGL